MGKQHYQETTRAQDWPLCERCGEPINKTLPGTPTLPDYAEARFCSEDCKLAAGEDGQHSLFKLEDGGCRPKSR